MRRGEIRANLLSARQQPPQLQEYTVFRPRYEPAAELREAVRQYLAWDSIWGDRVTLNLDQFQTRQPKRSKNADKPADARIPETFQC